MYVRVLTVKIVLDLQFTVAVLNLSGEALHGTIRHLLTVAYDLLDRDAFATVLQVRIVKLSVLRSRLTTVIPVY